MRLVAHFPLKKIKFVKYLILFIIGINQEGGGANFKSTEIFFETGNCKFYCAPVDN